MENIIPEPFDYKIFSEFIRNYSGGGFTGISNQDHFMIRMNRMLDKGRQFFFISDLVKLKLLYTSPQVQDITDTSVMQFDHSFNLSRTHPDQLLRRSKLRSNVILSGQDIYIRKSGEMFISSDFLVRLKGNEYTNVLTQSYLFYSSHPVGTVYIIIIDTVIDWASKFIKKGHYHWYHGYKMEYFRYPDEELLLMGSNLSDRELEILCLSHKGLASKEIGEKLSLSPFTINTHRRNILKKTGMSTIGEVAFSLEKIGII